MSIGLKRGIVELADHNPEWKIFAAQTIERLWGVFGDIATDIQHVGSTAICHIKAKPIIDIAVAVDDLDFVKNIMPKLNAIGFYESIWHAVENDILVCDDDEFTDTRSYHIHIVKTNSSEWNNYLNLRNYLTAKPEKAKEYEQVKITAALKHASDRNAYTGDKDTIIVRLLEEAHMWASFHGIGAKGMA